MGRKGSWISSVKKAFSPNSKQKKAKKENKSKNKLFEKDEPSVSNSSNLENVEVSYHHPLPPLEEVKLTEVENEETSNAYSDAVATAAVPTVPEVVPVTKVTKFPGKSVEEAAAIRIQTAFRGYLARRALRALRGLVRLKSLVDGPTAKRQTSNTLKCMQTLSHVQSQIQSRRIRMSEENRVLQRQLLQKRAKELESLRMGEEWDDSFQSKEQIESNLMHKFEAAMRRERALAYSYTHQQSWKKSAKSTNLLFMDPTNPQWGWSWLERWMAARPWETQTTADNSSIKSTSGGEITKSFARHQLNTDSPSSSANHKPPAGLHSPISKGVSSLAARKMKPLSPKGCTISQDDDSRSMISVQSERNRRHTIGGGSSVRDDESLAGGSPSVPSYMAPTRSAKAKSRLPSPLGVENGGASENGSVGPVKKRLSFPPSPAHPR
ncbi:hypothetical protein BUALT_Bualt19G0121200 [Buddleja alternifolia]|uniref:DUF4005 domain-containing protein n=1 Tax=Buddleja alternifolia TaxID=168488 RepID=A0AAV6WBN0_9LAMI|nr:hypothetical protein BUALT_Bualt19G0121200 [Buddleja alternifolia]